MFKRLEPVPKTCGSPHTLCAAVASPSKSPTTWINGHVTGLAAQIRLSFPSRLQKRGKFAPDARHSSAVHWDITADWQYDPALQTEIEVRFIPDGKNGTRVELEHRRLDRYGARRDEMRTIFDKTGDWGRLLQTFAQAAALEGSST
jgi:hypothetical protein